MYDTFLQQLIQINMLPLCLILFLVLFLRFNDRYEHELTVEFYPILVFILGLILVDNLDYYSYDVRNNGLLHVLIAVIGYNLRITILLSLIQVMLKNTGPGPIKKSGLIRKRIILFAPAILNLFITSLALFTHLVFWYDDNGLIVRGPFAYTPHFVALYYAVLVFAFSFYIRKHFGKTNEAIIIGLMTVLSMLGTYVEMQFSLRGILIGILAMAITFYYLCLHIEYFKYDILTGALNRTSFLADRQKFAAKGGGMIIMIDLNDLKKINDEKGHAEGDLALKSIVNTINHCIGFQNILYRVGGDEFVLLCKNMEEEGAKELIGLISEQLSKTEYSCAMGYASWDGVTKFEEAYERADTYMYVNKREQKEAVKTVKTIKTANDDAYVVKTTTKKRNKSGEKTAKAEKKQEETQKPEETGKTEETKKAEGTKEEDGTTKKPE